MNFRILNCPYGYDVSGGLDMMDQQITSVAVLVYDVTGKFFDFSREGVHSFWRRQRIFRVCEGHTWYDASKNKTWSNCACRQQY